MARTREYLLLWDATMANPNGDMLNENQPRHDERTNQLEVSDVRLKRFVREEWLNQGEQVLVQAVENDKGKLLSCASRISEIKKKENLDEQTLVNHILENYIDARLFGAVITKPKKDIMGPLQLTWSKSLHEAEIKFMQGNAAYPSKDGNEQSSIWGKYITPYALFKSYAVYNDNVAKKQEINVSEEDLDKFSRGLIDGLKNYRSTSKNQMPRILIEVVYNKHRVDGELDYVQVQKHEEDLQIRSIDQFTFDLSPLAKYYEEAQEHIDTVRIYVHRNAKVEGLHEAFECMAI